MSYWTTNLDCNLNPPWGPTGDPSEWLNPLSFPDCVPTLTGFLKPTMFTPAPIVEVPDLNWFDCFCINFKSKRQKVSIKECFEDVEPSVVIDVVNESPDCCRPSYAISAEIDLPCLPNNLGVAFKRDYRMGIDCDRTGEPFEGQWTQQQCEDYWNGTNTDPSWDGMRALCDFTFAKLSPISSSTWIVDEREFGTINDTGGVMTLTPEASVSASDKAIPELQVWEYYPRFTDTDFKRILRLGSGETYSIEYDTRSQASLPTPAPAFIAIVYPGDDSIFYGPEYRVLVVVKRPNLTSAVTLSAVYTDDGDGSIGQVESDTFGEYLAFELYHIPSEEEGAPQQFAEVSIQRTFDIDVTFSGHPISLHRAMTVSRGRLEDVEFAGAFPLTGQGGPVRLFVTTNKWVDSVSLLIGGLTFDCISANGPLNTLWYTDTILYDTYEFQFSAVVGGRHILSEPYTYALGDQDDTSAVALVPARLMEKTFINARTFDDVLVTFVAAESETNTLQLLCGSSEATLRVPDEQVSAGIYGLSLFSKSSEFLPVVDLTTVSPSVLYTKVSFSGSIAPVLRDIVDIAYEAESNYPPVVNVPVYVPAGVSAMSNYGDMFRTYPIDLQSAAQTNFQIAYKAFYFYVFAPYCNGVSVMRAGIDDDWRPMDELYDKVFATLLRGTSVTSVRLRLDYGHFLYEPLVYGDGCFKFTPSQPSSLVPHRERDGSSSYFNTRPLQNIAGGVMSLSDEPVRLLTYGKDSELASSVDRFHGVSGVSTGKYSFSVVSSDTIPPTSPGPGQYIVFPVGGYTVTIVRYDDTPPLMFGTSPAYGPLSYGTGEEVDILLSTKSLTITSSEVVSENQLKGCVFRIGVYSAGVFTDYQTYPVVYNSAAGIGGQLTISFSAPATMYLVDAANTFVQIHSGWTDAGVRDSQYAGMQLVVGNGSSVYTIVSNTEWTYEPGRSYMSITCDNSNRPSATGTSVIRIREDEPLSLLLTAAPPYRTHQIRTFLTGSIFSVELWQEGDPEGTVRIMCRDFEDADASGTDNDGNGKYASFEMLVFQDGSTTPKECTVHSHTAFHDGEGMFHVRTPFDISEFGGGSLIIENIATIQDAEARNLQVEQDPRWLSEPALPEGRHTYQIYANGDDACEDFWQVTLPIIGTETDADMASVNCQPGCSYEVDINKSKLQCKFGMRMEGNSINIPGCGGGGLFTDLYLSCPYNPHIPCDRPTAPCDCVFVIDYLLVIPLGSVLL